MSISAPLTFGPLLRYLRKQAGMTQGDLAAALGYSASLISSLETGDRLPDLEAVRNRFAAALGLQDDSRWSFALVEQAALARGTPLPDKPMPLPHPRLPFAPLENSDGVRLPALPTVLIGRSTEVNQLCNRLLGHAGRLLTLVGPPGVGKTTLALAVAAQIQHHYKDGACFVPLAAVSDPMLMASTILSAIAPDDASARPPQSRLMERLRRKSMLLILDNLEQIADAAPLIARMLSECPSLTILATSRERLHLRAEQRFNVLPLDLASAIQLFVQRAQAVDSTFALTSENQPTIAAICTQLDCLPLALELCAAQVEVFTLDQLLGQLRAHSLDLLVDGPHDLPPHQRTLRHAIQRSYDMLPVDEQTFFRRLGVFVGGFNVAAAEAMGEWRLAIPDSASSRLNLKSPISMLQALITKSLVRTETLDNGEPRFSLLETIREFALERLQLAGEGEAARQRHYAIYLQRFRDSDHHLRGQEVAACFARLLSEHDNLRAAIQWALDNVCYEDAAWLFIAASTYCRLRGYWYEDNDWLVALLPHRQQIAPELRLSLLINFASRARSPQDFERVRSYADELIALGNSSDNKLSTASVWHFLAKASDDFPLAESYWQKAIGLARDAGESSIAGAWGASTDRLFVLTSTIDHYVSRLINRGEFAQAQPLIQEGLQASEARGFMTGVAAHSAHSGHLALLQGDLAQAHRLLSEAVDLATANVHPIVLHRTQMLLAVVTLYRSEMVEARRLLMNSLETWKNVGDTIQLARAYIYLAEVALWEGETEQAAQWLIQAVGYRIQPVRLGGATWDALFVAAHLAVARQEYGQAAMLLGLAEETRLRARVTLVEPVRAQVDTALATVRTALDPVVYDAAFATGREMDLEEAFATILMRG